VLGEAMAGATVKVYASDDCSGEPLGSGSGAELLDPGFIVSVPAGSLTEFRATAEAEGFVSACSQPISYLQLSEEVEEVPVDGGGVLGTTPTPTVKLPPPVPGPRYLTPQTRITFAPAAKTRSRNPIFRFTDETGQSGTTFRCKVDRKPWKACTSPLRLKRLSPGKHVLRIKGTNAVGGVEPAAAKRTFRVVPR
jgi:hypothetical protein